MENIAQGSVSEKGKEIQIIANNPKNLKKWLDKKKFAAVP